MQQVVPQGIVICVKHVSDSKFKSMGVILFTPITFFNQNYFTNEIHNA